MELEGVSLLVELEDRSALALLKDGSFVLFGRFLELHFELFVQFEFSQIPPCFHNDGKNSILCGHL